MMHRRSVENISAALGLLLLAALWIAFAPIQLGGQASFVIVNGNSMEPVYRRGDLVIVRAATDYRVGDIVTYRHPDIGPVIHRIVGRSDDRWVLKGDHNDFIDSYGPGTEELIGRSWIHLPSAGSLLERLRTPPLMALLAAVFGVMLMTTVTRGARHPAQGPRAARAPAARRLDGWRCALEALLPVFALLALASLGLAAFAFLSPVSREAAEDLVYRQTGTFGYSAQAPPGLYDGPTARSGDPVFLKLASALDVSFDYRFTSELPAELRGSVRLGAVLSAENGWKRTIELAPPQEFSGPGAAARGRIDLAELTALVARYERETELQRQQYSLAITPEVTIDGSLDGQPLAESFTPRLVFRLDERQLQLLRDGRGEGDWLQPTAEGQIEHTREQPNTLTLLGLRLAVATARRAALLGLTLGGVSTLALVLSRTASRDEAARIRQRYGALIIDGGPGKPEVAGAIPLASIDDLARLAERRGALILHQARGVSHSYVVHDDGASYSYRVTGAASDPLEPVVPAPAGSAVQPAPSLDPGPSGGPQPSLALSDMPPHWRGAFLEALHETGSAADACRTVGVGLGAAYAERERHRAFARAWDETRTRALRRQSRREKKP